MSWGGEDGKIASVGEGVGSISPGSFLRIEIDVDLHLQYWGYALEKLRWNAKGLNVRKAAVLCVKKSVFSS